MQNVWICIIYTVLDIFTKSTIFKTSTNTEVHLCALSKQIIKNYCCIYSEYLTHNINILIIIIIINYKYN